ncbi:hypothetical protein [Asticcacaulis sp. 201]|uniref:hypothetical protein n=1 Tax=Asticcacaulis sp. 201 TaxID=3028787 RepID=UPI002916CC59|nr:hypothetical protein [Asticcacaulis sp. 201]MDV6333233.1 hypothetical protein [Asticcacaulis sp. 201]
MTTVDFAEDAQSDLSGTFFSVLQPDLYRSETTFERSEQVGQVNLRIYFTPKPSIIAEMVVSDGRAVRVETCPILGMYAGRFLLTIRWSFPILFIDVNSDRVGSNLPGDEVSTACVVYMPTLAVAPANNDSKNADAKRQREDEVAGLVLRKGRLPSTSERDEQLLRNATTQLSELLTAVKNGDLHHDTAMAARLRALVCQMDRPSNGYPLLQRIAAAQQLELIVFANANEFVMPKISIVPQLQMSTYPRICQGLAPIHPVDLDRWLRMPGAWLGEQKYTHNAIIRAFADTEADHYDLGEEPLIAELRKHSVGGTVQNNQLHAYLIGVADTMLSLCHFVLSGGRSAVFEWHNDPGVFNLATKA